MSGPLWRDSAPGWTRHRMAVTTLSTGQDLSLQLSVLRGVERGPTLGIMSGVHGDETMSLLLLRRLMDSLDGGLLRGVLVLLPVANPLALGAFSRFTPEQHGNVDLHTAFPGNVAGCLTQAIAATITSGLLDHVDALIDVHSGGVGRLQWRVDFDAQLSPELRQRCLEFCRQFGSSLLHENNLAGSASHHLNRRQIVTANLEIGGAYLGAEATDQYLDAGVRGITNALRHLGLLREAPHPPPRQLLYSTKSRVEVNPRRGGFLVSARQSVMDLGRPVTRGERLGEIFDAHSLELVEELVAPVSGVLFFSRYSGLVEAGAKAFGLAEEESSSWL